MLSMHVNVGPTPPCSKFETNYQRLLNYKDNIMTKKVYDCIDQVSLVIFCTIVRRSDHSGWKRQIMGL